MVNFENTVNNDAIHQLVVAANNGSAGAKKIIDIIMKLPEAKQ